MVAPGDEDEQQPGGEVLTALDAHALARLPRLGRVPMGPAWLTSAYTERSRGVMWPHNQPAEPRSGAQQSGQASAQALAEGPLACGLGLEWTGLRHQRQSLSRTCRGHASEAPAPRDMSAQSRNTGLRFSR